MEDTIAAISTPIGQGGIAIVRVSGPESITIADKIFVCVQGKPSSFPSHTIHYGAIVNGGVVIDEVLLSIMYGPKSYTAEDVVEINCHGGVVIARRVLASCLSNSARAAEPGEFTKRAFLNGRIDLSQAEAVMDIITSQTNLSHTSAMNVLAGKFKNRITGISDLLMGVLVHVEALIDFPEEEIVTETLDEMRHKISDALLGLGELIATAKEGKILRHGVRIAIIGRPNVGKSSLLNALLGEERAIVTAQPGTTRDTIEEVSDINGIPIYFIDTAGIRKTRGIIERVGIDRSYKALIDSDIAIIVIDGSRRFSDQDKEIIVKTTMKTAIYVISKADKNRKCKIPDWVPANKLIKTSVHRGTGIYELRQEIETQVWNGSPPNSEYIFSMNERHEESIRGAHCALQRVSETFKTNFILEGTAQDLRIALDRLGEISGRKTSEEVLEKIFSKFCIGK